MVTTADGPVADGITVSAFATLSVRPLLVVVAVGKEGLFLRRLLASRVFAVNLLSREQEHVARYFSDRHRPRTLPDFPGIATYAGATGVPILDGCLGYFDCAVKETHSYGDHELIVGDVRSVSDSAGTPLLYYDGEYHSLCEQVSICHKARPPTRP